MSKKLFNEGHFLELMDRLHVQSSMIETHLLKHPLTKKMKKVKKLIDKAHWNLLDAYQIVGQFDYNKNQKTNPIEKVIFGRSEKSKK